LTNKHQGTKTQGNRLRVKDYRIRRSEGFTRKSIFLKFRLPNAGVDFQFFFVEVLRALPLLPPYPDPWLFFQQARRWRRSLLSDNALVPVETSVSASNRALLTVKSYSVDSLNFPSLTPSVEIRSRLSTASSTGFLRNFFFFAPSSLSVSGDPDFVPSSCLTLPQDLSLRVWPPLPLFPVSYPFTRFSRSCHLAGIWCRTLNWRVALGAEPPQSIAGDLIDVPLVPLAIVPAGLFVSF